jgi:tetratricopeptide (TPR) repeat protein
LLHTYPSQGPLYFEAGLGYAQLGQHKVAARFFERADELGHPAAFEAADQYRLAQAPRKALELNAQVISRKKQLKQRLTIYLSANDYHRATSLEPLLTHHEALDDSSRFRLGYAYVQVQDINRAQKMAQEIEDPSRQEQLNALISRVRMRADTTTGFR